MNAFRIVLAILYSAAFVFSLTRCSPNVSSVDKSVLRGLRQQSSDSGSGGINVDATMTAKQPAVTVKARLLHERDFRRLEDEPKARDEVRITLTSNETKTGSLDSLKEKGETVFSLENSSQLFPAELSLLIKPKGQNEQTSTENCSFDVQSLRDGMWRISLRDSDECKSKQEPLSQVDELLISFRAKDSRHLVDTVMAPDAP